MPVTEAGCEEWPSWRRHERCLYPVCLPLEPLCPNHYPPCLVPPLRPRGPSLPSQQAPGMAGSPLPGSTKHREKESGPQRSLACQGPLPWVREDFWVGGRWHQSWTWKMKFMAFQRRTRNTVSAQKSEEGTPPSRRRKGLHTPGEDTKWSAGGAQAVW